MDHTQKMFYERVKYFLFLVQNGNWTAKSEIKSANDITHNVTHNKKRRQTIITKFLKDSENCRKTDYTQEEIKDELLEKYRLCDCFDWCDTFIHPFINLNDLQNMSSKSRKYITTIIFREMLYHNRSMKDIKYLSLGSDELSFEETIEVMEFHCKYGSHSLIGYVEKLTHIDKDNIADQCALILNEKLDWVQ